MPADSPDELYDEAERAFRELVLAIEAYRADSAVALNLSRSDAQAVSYLIARGPLGQHELAIALALTTGSITALVDRLEANGIVERLPHPTDRRRTTVHLTAGSALKLQATRGRTRRALESLAQQDLSGSIEVMTRLTQAIRELGSS